MNYNRNLIPKDKLKVPCYKIQNKKTNKNFGHTIKALIIKKKLGNGIRTRTSYNLRSLIRI